MKQNKNLILTFFFLGLLLLGTAFLVSKWLDPVNPAAPVLARIEKISEPVFILKRHLTQQEQLRDSAPLRALETVSTGADGEALLTFPSDYRLKLKPNSEITLDIEADRTIVYLKTGDVDVEASGREGSLFISKYGVRVSASEYKSNNKGDLGLKAPELRETKNPESKEGLSPSYILETLKSQKNVFYKCYTQLLQRTPGVTGEASLSVTIETNGKISRSEITSSNLNEPAFKKCLIEAVNRIEFKAFHGEAITTVFPLQFE